MRSQSRIHDQHVCNKCLCQTSASVAATADAIVSFPGKVADGFATAGAVIEVDAFLCVLLAKRGQDDIGAVSWHKRTIVESRVVLLRRLIGCAALVDNGSVQDKILLSGQCDCHQGYTHSWSTGQCQAKHEMKCDPLQRCFRKVVHETWHKDLVKMQQHTFSEWGSQQVAGFLVAAATTVRLA
eukprot:5569371-Amphidinium_carterae.1